MHVNPLLLAATPFTKGRGSGFCRMTCMKAVQLLTRAPVFVQEFTAVEQSSARS